jgi:hypothetical protein
MKKFGALALIIAGGGIAADAAVEARDETEAIDRRTAIFP